MPAKQELHLNDLTRKIEQHIFELVTGNQVYDLDAVRDISRAIARQAVRGTRTILDAEKRLESNANAQRNEARKLAIVANVRRIYE